MKLSDTTISVLKNYSSINQNLKIGAGNNLVTMSAMKNIVAQSKVEETFEKDVAIYDLNEFLAAMSLFDSPELDFEDEYLMIITNRTSSLKYWYSDPSVVTTVTKDMRCHLQRLHLHCPVMNCLISQRSRQRLVRRYGSREW